jgi:hypothetical protein
VADAGFDITITQGNSATIGGVQTGTGGTPPLSYLWFPPDDLNDSGAANPIASPLTTTTYSLFVIDSVGCAGTDNVTVIVISPANGEQTDKDNEEVTDEFSARISIAPNPSDGTINLNINNSVAAPAPVNVRIIDIMGRLIYNWEGQVEGEIIRQIDLSNYGSAIYSMQITLAGKTVTKLIVIAK